MRDCFAKVLGFLFLCLFSGVATAQVSPFVKFGRVSEKELQQKVYDIDSSADAVVLSDIGSAFIQGNIKGWFSLISTRHRVVHILSKAAYADPTSQHNVAAVEIELYTNGEEEERIEDLKAVTYNLEKGKIIATPLDKGSVFTEKRTRNLLVKKFAFPAVKEGSIIEFEYKVSSDFLGHVDPWYFQGTIPSLWSEYNFSVPQFYTYSFVNRGYITPFVTQKTPRNEQFLIREVARPGSTYAGDNQAYTINASVMDYRIAMKDVPGLKKENFTSSLKNHLARLECQLVAQSDPLVEKDFRSTWPALTKTLLTSDYFGKGLLKENNGWLSEEAQKIVAGSATKTEKAKAIFLHVRNNIACTGNEGIYTDQLPATTLRTKKGTVAEINLLLTTLLLQAGLEAAPVILSTREHGFTVEAYPLLSPFNYVVVQVQTERGPMYLDASNRHLGFARLLPFCYNGHARVVNEAASPVYFVPDSLKERKTTSLYLAKGSNALWEGSFTQDPGYYASFGAREKLVAEGPEKFLKEMQKEFGTGSQLANLHIDSLNDDNASISLRCDVGYTPDGGNLIYINPMFGAGYKTNPFKSAERQYPVEMPFATDDIYSLSMEVPDGYEIEELPRGFRAKFDAEGKTFFEYQAQSVGGIVLLSSRIKIDRTLYEPNEYEALRAFFNLIVKKQAEQIVFRKKK